MVYEKKKLAPAMAGIVLLVLGVGIAGSTVVQDNAPRDWRWFTVSSAPFRWLFTPRGRDLDLYLGVNLIPLTFLVVSAALLVLVTRRRDRWSFATVFFSTWGAVVAAGVVAGTVYTLYSKVILDLPDFVPGGGFLNEWHFQTGMVLEGATFAGVFVAFLVAVVAAIVGSSEPSHDPYSPGESHPSPYAGSPVDPSPPMAAPPPYTGHPPPPPAQP